MNVAKKCSACKILKTPDNFYKNRSTSNGLHSECKSCHFIREKKRYKTPKRQTAIRKSRITRQSRNRKYVLDHLLSKSCVDCGETNPIKLVFDHVSNKKISGVGHLAKSLRSIKLISDEIKKCDVRCHNCHAIKTAEGQNWYNSRFCEKPKLLYKKLSPNGELKQPAYDGDCGYNITCSENTIVPPRTQTPISVNSDIAIKVPDEHVMLMLPRSSANKRGLMILTGVIDSGYVGPLFILLYNMTDSQILLKKGDSVAQCVFVRFISPTVIQVDELPETARGTRGFGSSGN